MNINVKFCKNFTTQFNRMVEKYGEDFLKLQGFDDDTLSYVNFIDNFVDTQNVADASVDGNSNVKVKDIVPMTSEMSKPHQKLIAFNKIYYEAQKKYGFKFANEMMESLWNYDIYLHDFNTSTFWDYCFAADLKPIAEKGLYFNDGTKPYPPQHLDTFVSFIMKWVEYLSRRQSGAVGMPNLIPYMFYFWNKDKEAGRYKDPIFERDQQIQALIFQLNQNWVRGDQSAFTNVTVFDHPYFEAIFGGAEFPDGTFMIDYEEEIIEFQKAFIDVFNKTREENVFTFPVLTASLLYQNGKFVDEDFAKWACEASRKWNIFNFFTDSTVNSLSNCCRLKSDITDSYFNSIGGTALEVGSVKVATLNLARLAYIAKNEQEYLVLVKDLVEKDLKILDIVRGIIKRNIEKGLLPTYTHGLKSLESQYNTVGINGIYETMRTFGYVKFDEFGKASYKPEAFSFVERIFKTITNVGDMFCLDKDYKWNKEQVPAEQAASKMQKADEFLFPDKVIKDLSLYGNQWIPLGIDASLQERVKICAAFDKFCNGGSIMHINIDKPFDTFEKAWDLLNWVASQGVTYFAFNGKVSQCEDSHNFYGETCPVCGRPKSVEFTRVVGFYVPTTSWSKARKEEFAKRKWMPLNDNGILN